MIPRATYRLQFHKGFTFADAAPLAPYLAALGVSHVYASPVATARPGSIHGYDVVDPTRINPELGGGEGFRALCEALRAEGLGVILDIVPNHLAVGGSENRWWLDILENGEASEHAALFDIDWRTGDEALAGRVMAPFLGAAYGEALSGGDIRLEVGEDGRLAAIAYGVHRLPIRAEDRAEVLEAGLAAYDPASAEGRERLHALLERQNFRLAWWRAAGDEINWRRFFDVNELAAVRGERDEAFDLIHALPLRLYAEGLIDGVRADHVDGLADPAAYCRRLRERLDAAGAGRPAWAAPGPAYVVVEKILALGEDMPAAWGVDGTTGYDFMNEVSVLLHDPAGEARLTAAWAEISGRADDFEAEERTARAEVLAWSFPGQLEAAARAFHRLARADLTTQDLTLGALRRALKALITAFPAYRTYATAEGLPEESRPILREAVARARGRTAPGEAAVIDQIAAWLEGEGDRGLAGEAARRLQQLSAPVAAKGVEDTAFYRYGRLLSRNDVGFDPGRFAAPVAAFHEAAAARAARFPHAMLATATHDHKRGEDVRARLAVLSEVPDLWTAAARRWADLNAAGEPIHPADAYMLYQTLAGAWPLDLAADDAEGLAALRDRVAQWQEKALREGKLRSSWAAPDEAYEAGCRRFLEAILDPGRSGAFLADLVALVDEIAPAGAVNGLAQALLRCTAPGVPDTYQGAEFWDLSLVDPDNRRPVDYAARAAALAAGPSPADLLGAWRDGRVKQAVLARALGLRRDLPDLFADGDYEPLEIRGARAGSAVAFLRRRAGTCVVAAAAIRCAPAVLGADAPLPPADWWADTAITLPEPLSGLRGESVLTDAAPGAGGGLAAAELFAALPVALLRFDG